MNLPGDEPWQRAAFLVAAPCLMAPFVWAFNYQSYNFPFGERIAYVFQAAVLFDGASSDGPIVWAARIGVLAALVRVFGTPLLGWLFKRSSPSSQ